MSYKIEIMDEYSFGQWFSHHLRFATQAEAEACSRQFSGAAWNGILDLRVVPSDEPVNASWTEKGVLDNDGQPINRPPAIPTLEETQREAKRPTLKLEQLVGRLEIRQTLTRKLRSSHQARSRLTTEDSDQQKALTQFPPD